MNIEAAFATVKIGKRKFQFTSLKDVSKAYRAVIEELDLGASEAPNCDLLSANGEKLGYVSYNGRVWRGVDFPNAICVYEPE
jgi:hypothetical protein